ncbi:hypothetical protein J6590_094338 [Homalodisca vitripennis]|nr:hypothetical protein J6590_094338 [Homalodisca vitripennis]
MTDQNKHIIVIWNDTPSLIPEGSVKPLPFKQICIATRCATCASETCLNGNSLQHVAQHVPGTKLFQTTVKQNMLRNLYHELLETGCNNVPGLAHAQYCLLAVNLTSTITDTCSLFKS